MNSATLQIWLPTAAKLRQQIPIGAWREGKHRNYQRYQSMADWAGLPFDILASISDRLTFPVDYVSFRSVCHPWRSSSPKRPQPPLLLLPLDPATNNCRFFSFTDEKVHRISLPFPKPGTQRCCGSSQGWLFLADHTSRDLILLNPFTRAKLKLPPLISGRTLGRNGQDGTTHWPEMVDMTDYDLHKAVLSSNPCPGSNHSWAMGVFSTSDDGWKLAMCQIGEVSTWVVVEESSQPIYDVIFFQERFIAMDKHWKVCIIDIFPLPKVWQSSYTDWPGICRQGYLVESDGELLAAMSYHPWNHVNQVEYLVWKLDFSNGVHPQKSRVRSLGDKMLFVGVNQSLSIASSWSSRVAGFQGNSVYYTNCEIAKLEDDFKYEHCWRDYGWFDLEFCRAKSLPGCKARSPISWGQSIWVTPNLLPVEVVEVDWFTRARRNFYNPNFIQY